MHHAHPAAPAAGRHPRPTAHSSSLQRLLQPANAPEIPRLDNSPCQAPGPSAIRLVRRRLRRHRLGASQPTHVCSVSHRIFQNPAHQPTSPHEIRERANDPPSRPTLFRPGLPHYCTPSASVQLVMPQGWRAAADSPWPAPPLSPSRRSSNAKRETKDLAATWSRARFAHGQHISPTPSARTRPPIRPLSAISRRALDTFTYHPLCKSFICNPADLARRGALPPAVPILRLIPAVARRKRKKYHDITRSEDTRHCSLVCR